MHHTLKSIFGGKSRAEIDRMEAERDPDLMEFIQKYRIKRAKREDRDLEAFLRSVEPRDPD